MTLIIPLVRSTYTDNIFSCSSLRSSQTELPTLEQKGWKFIRTRTGVCDGTSSTRCNLDADNNCPFYGHHDGEGGLLAEGESEEVRMCGGLRI